VLRFHGHTWPRAEAHNLVSTLGSRLWQRPHIPPMLARPPASRSPASVRTWTMRHCLGSPLTIDLATLGVRVALRLGGERIVPAPLNKPAARSGSFICSLLRPERASG
jgi:hypothetical protein